MSEIDITAQMDQMGASMRSFAGPVATYYQALVENGVPAELAGDLVREWQGIYFASVYGVRYHCDG